MSADVLSSRALNRATLERQLLLRRSDRTVLDAVDHLVGLQAQVPQNPYVALWSRLDRFEPDELGQLLLDRKVVRIVVMRATIHLVTADDCLLLRPLVQPVLDGELARHGEYGAAFARHRPRACRRLRRSVARLAGAHGRRAARRAARSRSPTSTPPPSPTPVATGWRCSRCRRGGSGGARARSGPRPRRPGWGVRWPSDRRSTPSCSATWRRSGRRRWPTPRRGRG